MNKLSNKQGFTLIELLIVIFITGMLSTIVLVNFRNGERQKRVALGADGIINTLRLAQNYTLSGKQIPDLTTAQSGSTPCSNNDNSIADYRVRIRSASGTINLFADDKCGGVFLIDSFQLPDNTEIASNGMQICDPICNSYATVRVQFEPPFGRMKISGSEAGLFDEFASLSVTVTSKDGTKTKTVGVDGVSGKIGE